jgi:hypothetical protein
LLGELSIVPQSLFGEGFDVANAVPIKVNMGGRRTVHQGQGFGQGFCALSANVVPTKVKRVECRIYTNALTSIDCLYYMLYIGST